MEVEAPYHNPDFTAIADKFLAYAHWAGYIVFENVNGAWTAAQQIAWAFKAIEGSALTLRPYMSFTTRRMN